MKPEKTGIKIVATNRKARYSYHILDTLEAGIVLQGTEVKSLRNGKANIADSHARVLNGELFLFHLHISPYEQGNIYNHEPTRPRKLLLHKREIRRLEGRVQEKGLTLVPLKIYFKSGKAKVELGLARGKKLHDKRTDISQRDAQRDVEREMRRKQ
ncbi:SsrA-binding protein SmpB [bacterium]|nr:SsrA-binding protein SmpB [bacterium]